MSAPCAASHADAIAVLFLLIRLPRACNVAARSVSASRLVVLAFYRTKEGGGGKIAPHHDSANLAVGDLVITTLWTPTTTNVDGADGDIR